jgi:hypothetical protein
LLVANNPMFGLSTLLVWIVVALVIIAATGRRLSYQRYRPKDDGRQLLEGPLPSTIPAPVADREQVGGKVRASA